MVSLRNMLRVYEGLIIEAIVEEYIYGTQV